MVPTGATRRVATVFGGSGFLGRYIVKRFAQRGYVVRVAVRDPEAALFLKPMGAVGQVVPLYASIENDATVARAVEDADVVVSLVGILAENRKGDFERIHVEGAGRIARFAAAAGVVETSSTCRRSAPIRRAKASTARARGAANRPSARPSRVRRSCGLRWYSARRTTSSTASA